jgi:hypothetical protein
MARCGAVNIQPLCDHISLWFESVFLSQCRLELNCVRRALFGSCAAAACRPWRYASHAQAFLTAATWPLLSCTFVNPPSRRSIPAAFPAMSAKVKPFYAQEISQRPPQTLFQRIHGLLCAFVFLLGCLFGNGTQFLLSPLLLLRLFPFPQASRVYTQAIRFTKGGFGTLLGTSLRGQSEILD